jgi:uncharacterized protein YggT (Ycf19 family)
MSVVLLYQLVTILKALVEVVGLALIGQGIVALLAGPAREQNLVYRLFRVVTDPFLKLTRAITPRIVLDQHIGIAAVLLLVGAWFVLLISKIYLTLLVASEALPR